MFQKLLNDWDFTPWHELSCRSCSTIWVLQHGAQQCCGNPECASGPSVGPSPPGITTVCSAAEGAVNPSSRHVLHWMAAVVDIAGGDIILRKLSQCGDLLGGSLRGCCRS